jgi:hypothetical protein
VIDGSTVQHYKGRTGDGGLLYPMPQQRPFNLRERTFDVQTRMTERLKWARVRTAPLTGLGWRIGESRHCHHKEGVHSRYRTMTIITKARLEELTFA